MQPVAKLAEVDHLKLTDQCPHDQQRDNGRQFQLIGKCLGEDPGKNDKAYELDQFHKGLLSNNCFYGGNIPTAGS